MTRRRDLAVTLLLCIEICSCDIILVTCDEPPPVANAYRTLSSYQVQYTCIDNHVHVSGNLLRTCVYGQYDGTPPVCKLQCGPPLDNAGVVLNSTGSDVGTELTYRCPDGSLLDYASSECDGTKGTWTQPDYCFKNEPHDPSMYLSVYVSSATELASGTTVSETASGDVTILQEGGCITTIGRENKPNIKVTFDDKYYIHTVVFTLGQFEHPLQKVQVNQYWSESSTYARACQSVTTEREPGDTVNVICSPTSLSPCGVIEITADFGNMTDRLEICNLNLYARPRTTVDCGQPLECIYAVRENEPLSTFYTYNNRDSRVFYSCIAGYHVQSGRGYSFCQHNAVWSTPLVCTDRVNFAQEKQAWFSNFEHKNILLLLTDSITSNCMDILEHTITVDLGTRVQVSDITVVSDASVWRTMTAEVVQEGGARTQCGSTRVYEMASNFACSQHPTGRYIDIRQSEGSSLICEIFVHGQANNEVPECYRDYRGRDYRGNMNMTINGTPCQEWNSSTPHPHNFRDVTMFPDTSLSDLGNYCRNPNDRTRPWCFTTDPDQEWQYCPLLPCNSFCKFDEVGTAYTGIIAKTATGENCQLWTSPELPFKQQKHRSTNYDSNYCRNPLASQSQPWCFTSRDGSQYGFCTIPICPITSDFGHVNWIIDATFQNLKMDYCAVWNRNHYYNNPQDTGFFAYRYWLYSVRVCPTGKMFNTTFICYKLEGTSPEWISGTIDCVNCGPPPPVSHTSMTYKTTFLHSIATYNCLPGYNLASGSNTASCLRSGNWSVADALCLINCTAPPDVEHATSTVNSTLEGDEVVYTCVTGSKHVSGSDSVTCLATGNWSTSDLICTVYCGPPPSVSNTSVSNSTELEGARAIYTCLDGFTHVSGSDNSTCLSSGNWTEPQIYCEVDCGEPPSVENASVTAETTVLNSTALYSCHSGYVHVTGSRMVMCRDTGSWEEPEILCLVDCGDPHQVGHTLVSYNSSYLNSTCVYSCAEGYGYSSGSPVSTCGSDGRWEVPTFTCLINCTAPPDVEQATSTTNSTLEGDTAVYTCVNGTKHVSGSDSVTCLATGRWSTAEYICTVHCGPPPSVNNTSVSNSTELEGARVIYTCLDGFKHVSGSDSSTCLSSGNWTEPQIYCEVDCGEPPAVENARVTAETTVLNSTALYSCDSGYVHVTGSRLTMCRETGLWEEPEILCLVDCGDPPQVEHTVVSYNSSYLNSTCVYSCVEGYGHSSGSPVSTCGSDGRWEVTTFTCQMSCQDPPIVEHATPIVNSTLAGDEAVYTCVDGSKHVSGSESVTCLASGTWSTPDFTCAVHCGPSPFVNNTSVSNSTELEGARVIYTCLNGFTHVSGSDNSTCLSSGNWTEPQIYCEEIVTTTVQPPRNTTDKYGRERYGSCTCRCKVKMKPVEDAAQEITKKLTLETKDLSSSVQKKTSKPDNRTSSKGMAVLAGLMMALVGGLIFIPDLLSVIQFLKTQ